MSDRLFTPRFFVMCGFTFTVFLSAFQLLPTAPFRIQELGGSTFASGLFLGFLTYASAASAPLTGAIADRIGRRRTLIIASSVILLCAIGYGVTTSYPRDARARPRARRLLVRPALGLGRLPHPPAARAPPRRRHRLLGPVERRRDRGRAADRLLDHAARRLAVDLHLLRHAQPADGRRSPSRCPRIGSRRSSICRCRSCGRRSSSGACWCCR